MDGDSLLCERGWSALSYPRCDPELLEISTGDGSITLRRAFLVGRDWEHGVCHGKGVYVKICSHPAREKSMFCVK